MRKILSTLLIFFVVTFFYGSFLTNAYGEGIDYEKWDNILNIHADYNGRVNYAELKTNRADLDDFIEEVLENALLTDLSKNEQKAFWINAYNALTLRLIIDHYSPKLKGIRSINWRRPWSLKMKVAGRNLTLGDIEHQILRKWVPLDPRIHFAISCASIGCAQLPNTHFDADTLDEQLDRETRKFMNDPEKIRLNRSKNIIYLSPILKWFKEDFGDVIKFVSRYLPKDDAEFIKDNNPKIKYLNYDWSLNKKL